ncbi:MAG: type II secretion system protein [Opitutae bacterium]|nr:type II secretion system protein [Opitutae bacterium]MDG1302315.1 type II secretion system protein [Opitutae bacterium]
MKKYASKRGFTLIELLVVISVILIASSIIFIGGNGGAGASLSASNRIVSGIAKGARGQAILKSSRTRLIIYTDNSNNPDEEKYLRYFGIVYEDNDNPGQWIAATQGTYLPEGIYFDSTVSSSKGWPTSATMNLQYPRSIAKPEGNGDEFYFYEFNSNGTMSSDFVNDWLVIRAGTLKPNASNQLELEFEAEEQAIISALILRRSGTTTPVYEPADIL